MTPEQIENGIHVLSYGDTRFITKNNPPQENGLGVVTPEGKGFNAALSPGDEFTHFYQMNPVKGKRLLAKAKSPVGSPGGSAFHPVSYSTEKYGPISQRASFSADGDSVREQIPTKTGKIKNSGAVVIPAASMVSIPESGLLRQFLLGMRGVAEGMGSIVPSIRGGIIPELRKNSTSLDFSKTADKLPEICLPGGCLRTVNKIFAHRSRT